MKNNGSAAPRPIFVLRRYQDLMARQAVDKKDATKLANALARGANPNAVYSRHPKMGYCDRTHILHAAITARWIDGVELLLFHGADRELRSGKLDATPLFIAADDRNLKMMRLLVEAGCSLGGMGWTINQAKVDQKMDLLGWDYPGQHDWIEYHQITVSDLVKANKDPEERREILMGEAVRVQGKPSSPSPRPKM